MTKPVI